MGVKVIDNDSKSRIVKHLARGVIEAGFTFDELVNPKTFESEEDLFKYWDSLKIDDNKTLKENFGTECIFNCISHISRDMGIKFTRETLEFLESQVILKYGDWKAYTIQVKTIKKDIYELLQRGA